MSVVMENRAQLCPWSGRPSNAARSGRDQNSPNKEWKVRSPKYSLLLESISMRIICSTADGMESMLESKVEKPIRFRVSDR